MTPDDFLRAYPPEMRDLANRARDLVRSALPFSVEQVKTGWHAIMMTPAVGAPWCIVSTIEGMSEVRERHSFLNAKFGADARERFRRALAKAQGSSGQGDGQSGSPRGGSDVPARFE